MEDANGHITHHTYDAFDRPGFTTLPLGQQSSMGYNGLGQMTHQTDFNADTLNYAYDRYGRLNQRTFGNSQIPAIGYNYDPITSQITNVTDGRGVTGYRYDSRDRLEQITRPDGQTVRYGYDLLDNITSVTTAASTVNYGYDPLNRLDIVMVGNQTLADYDYDAAGRLVKTTLADGTVESAEYDSRDRLIGITTIQPGQSQTLPGYRYTLDQIGNRIKVQEAAGRMVAYTYDTQDRLIQEVVTDADGRKRTISYAYDAVGNRTSRSDDGGTGTTTYTYDANDRLTTVTTGNAVESFRSDNNGSLLERSTGQERTRYEWRNEGENRLRKVTVEKPNQTSTVEYAYDASGNRVSRIADGVQTNYLTAPMGGLSQVLMEYDPSGQVLADYTYGLGLVRSKRGTTERFFHSDGLGSTRSLSDPMGRVTDRYDYDAYGQLLSSSGSSVNPYLFAGEQRDLTTGLDYLRARYYAPDLGRFISKDAFAGFIESPISQHSYLYANGNPVNFADPSGYNTLNEVLAGVALIGILNSLFFSLANSKYLHAAEPTPEDFWNDFDGWVAGFADIVTLGISTTLRTASYGEWATRNHSGFMWNMGQIAGVGAQLALFSSLFTQAEAWLLRFEDGPLVWNVYIRWGLPVIAGTRLQKSIDNGQFDLMLVFDFLLSLLPTQAASRGLTEVIRTNRAIVDSELIRKLDRMIFRLLHGHPPSSMGEPIGVEVGPVPTPWKPHMSSSGGRGSGTPPKISSSGNSPSQPQAPVPHASPAGGGPGSTGGGSPSSPPVPPIPQVVQNQNVGNSFDSYVGGTILSTAEDLGQLATQQKLPTPDLAPGKKYIRPDYTIYASDGTVAAYADAKTGSIIPFNEQAIGLVNWSTTTNSRKLVYYTPEGNTPIDPALTTYANQLGVQIVQVAVP